MVLQSHLDCVDYTMMHATKLLVDVADILMAVEDLIDHRLDRHHRHPI